MDLTAVGSFELGWGESLVWDEQRQRLWFADCAAQTVHWIAAGDDALHTHQMDQLITGIVPCTDGRLVLVRDADLALFDPESGALETLVDFPTELGGRANDACADLAGNLITGKLNLGQAEGSTWRYSPNDGWSMLDPDIANTNGPGVAVIDGTETLVIGDTSAHYFASDYDSATGANGPRRVFGDTTELDGAPDGSTFDAENGLWCALVGGGQLARFTTDGLDRTIALPVVNPTDVTFGGPDLDRLYVVSIGGDGDLDGRLLVLEGLDVMGRLEPRFALR